MYALIAAVIAIAVIAMMWRFLDNEVSRRNADDGDEPARPRPTLPRRTPKPQTRIVAPDDDPEFLRELGKRIDKKPDDGQPA